MSLKSSFLVLLLPTSKVNKNNHLKSFIHKIVIIKSKFQENLGIKILKRIRDKNVRDITEFYLVTASRQ